MPIGLKNAPAKSQRSICQVGFCGRYTHCFENFSENVTYLKSVLKRLKQACLKVKPSNFVFAEERINHLGFVLSPKEWERILQPSNFFLDLQ